MRYIWMNLLPMFLMAVLLACQPAGSSTQVPQPQNAGAQTDVPGSNPQISATQDAAPLSTLEDTEMSTPITPDASVEPIVTVVKQHLAQKLSISVDQIVLSDIKPVVWRDAGLGCPKLGVDYIQVATPGYSIVLEAGGKTYNYHTDESRRFVPCNS